MGDNMARDPEIANWLVLIVDDEPDNLGVASRIFKFYGGKTITASSGEEALKILQTATPTIILLDLSMPHMSGWELLRHIRNMPDKASTPILAVTAHVMLGDKERALAAGFDGYIGKPFLLETFVSDVKKAVKLMTGK
jgi:CheY-like chemotaxis protein